MKDLGLLGYHRPKDSQPREILTHKKAGGDERKGPFPTNAWYQNLLLVEGEPSEVHRTYPIPYIMDTVGPVPGLRLHPNHVLASSEVVQVYSVEQYGLTLGAAPDATRTRSTQEATRQFHVEKATNLGVTLEWVRGFK